MRSLLVIMILVSAHAASAKDTYVNGYTKSNGTYVNGYNRTAPDHSQTNNYSYQGNTNPYTGQTGNKAYKPSGGFNNTGSNNMWHNNNDD